MPWRSGVCGHLLLGVVAGIGLGRDERVLAIADSSHQCRVHRSRRCWTGQGAQDYVAHLRRRLLDEPGFAARASAAGQRLRLEAGPAKATDLVVDFLRSLKSGAKAEL